MKNLDEQAANVDEVIAEVTDQGMQQMVTTFMRDKTHESKAER